MWIKDGNIVQRDAEATVDCEICGKTEQGLPRQGRRGGAHRIININHHFDTRTHQSRLRRGDTLWPRVIANGVNGTPFVPSPPQYRYRCICCSLSPEGQPIKRYWNMEAAPRDVHITGADHARRCGDGRIELFLAAGVAWAVPVVVARAPVVVPRLPQP